MLFTPWFPGFLALCLFWPFHGVKVISLVLEPHRQEKVNWGSTLEVFLRRSGCFPFNFSAGFEGRPIHHYLTSAVPTAKLLVLPLHPLPLRRAVMLQTYLRAWHMQASNRDPTQHQGSIKAQTLKNCLKNKRSAMPVSKQCQTQKTQFCFFVS